MTKAKAKASNPKQKEEKPRICVDDLCELSEGFLERKQYEKAVALYERGLKLYPNSLALRINLGKARNLLKEQEDEQRLELEENFRDERRRRDRLAQEFHAMGEMMSSKGDEDKAIEFYHLSLAHNPFLLPPHFALAKVFYRANEFASALRHLKQALQLNPFHQESLALAGRTLFYLKDYDGALTGLLDAMIIDRVCGRPSSQELQEKVRYLWEKLGLRSKTTRQEKINVRLAAFQKASEELDLAKDVLADKGALKDIKDLLARSRHDRQQVQRNLLQLALRLRSFPLFADLNDEFLFSVAKKVREIMATPDETIFQEEDTSDDLYLIEKGTIRICKGTPFGEQFLARIVQGEFLGEMNFIDAQSRSADAKADGETTLLVLSRADLAPLFEEHKELAVQFFWHFWKSLSRRVREANELLKTFFSEEGSEAKPMDEGSRGAAAKSKEISIDLDKKLKILQEQGLSAKELRLLAAFSSEELYNRDEAVFHEGDVGDKLYIILDGKVRISKHIPGIGEEALAILGKGDFFGEMALIDNESRSADAKAHVNGTTVLTISREVLNEILSVDIESAYQFLSILCRILTKRLREINLKIVQWRLMSGGF